MKFIGAHVSIAGGIENAPINAAKIGAQSFALFTKNQKQWEAKPLSEDNIKKFNQNCLKFNFSKEYILPHDSYLINLGSPEKEKLEKSRKSFKEEIHRCKQMGLKYLNFHPGTSQKKISDKECLDIVSESINIALTETENIILVIENTAGSGGQIGYKFEHLAYLIEKTKDKNSIGVCLDTCHAFAAGHDLRTGEKYEDTMREFEKIIGFNFLMGIHINDSKSGFKSRVDRHHSIGKGNLGINAFKFIMNDPRLDNIPIILETIDQTIWPEEIKLLHSLID